MKFWFVSIFICIFLFTFTLICNSEIDPRIPLTKQQIDVLKPILEKFASELEKITQKYPEMVEFKKDKVIRQSEYTIDLAYKHNFILPTKKRSIKPSDFGEKGFYISIRCHSKPRPRTVYAMSPPTLSLNNMYLYVWVEIAAAPNPSEGLITEINKVLDPIKQELQERDKDFIPQEKSEK
jgi:hypothetical protein